MKNFIKSCLLRRRYDKIINKDGAPVILAAPSERKRKNYGSSFVGNFLNNAAAIINNYTIFVDPNIFADNTAVTFRAIKGNFSFCLCLRPLNKYGSYIRFSKDKNIVSYSVHYDIFGSVEFFISKSEALNFLGNKLFDLVVCGYSITLINED